MSKYPIIVIITLSNHQQSDLCTSWNELKRMNSNEVFITFHIDYKNHSVLQNHATLFQSFAKLIYQDF